MPGFDGTGPWGLEPGSGRGRGVCGAPYHPVRGGGYGYGCGRGRGCGPGPRRGYRYAMTGQEKKAALEAEARYLKQELEALEKEMESLSV